MNLHKNTPKRLIGGLVALIAVFTSFSLLSPKQAESLTAAIPAVIAGGAAIWHPKHERPKRSNHGSTDPQVPEV